MNVRNTGTFENDLFIKGQPRCSKHCEPAVKMVLVRMAYRDAPNTTMFPGSASFWEANEREPVDEVDLSTARGFLFVQILRLKVFTLQGPSVWSKS